MYNLAEITPKLFCSLITIHQPYKLGLKWYGVSVSAFLYHINNGTVLYLKYWTGEQKQGYLLALCMRAVMCVFICLCCESKAQHTDFGLFICAVHVQTVLLSQHGFGPR